MTRAAPRYGFRWAMVPVALWAMYIGVGWAVAPAWCESPILFHGASAVVVAVAAGSLSLGRAALRRIADDSNDRQSASGFTVYLGVILGVLFLAGTVLAWVVAGVWCG